LPTFTFIKPNGEDFPPLLLGLSPDEGLGLPTGKDYLQGKDYLRGRVRIIP